MTAFAFSRLPSGFVPTQDKRYLVAFAQLPDGATLDRTTSSCGRWRRSASSSPASPGAVQFPGLSINGFVNASNAGIIFFALTPFEERRSKELYGPAIAGALNQKFGGDPGRVRGGLPTAARHGARHRRRVQDGGRGSLGPRRRRAGQGDAGPGRPRAPDAGARRPVLEQSHRRSAAGRRGRSREGQASRPLADGAVPNHADLPRLGLRQRLQPLRPDLSGHRPGGCRASCHRRRHHPAQGAERRRRDGAAGVHAAGESLARRRPAAALQRLPRRRHQRRPGARRQLGSGGRRDGAPRAGDSAQRRWVRVDRAHVPAAAGG